MTDTQTKTAAKTLGAGIGIGALGAIAIATIIGAGGDLDLPYEVGGHQIKITQEQFDAIAAEFTAQGVWKHEAGGVETARIALIGEQSTPHAVVTGTVIAPANNPPKGPSVRVSRHYVKAVRAAQE